MYEHLSFLGIRLRAQRQKRRLTLRDVARGTGLSAGLLSKIENFRTIPSLPVLLTIARELRLDPAELFSGLPDAERRPWLLVRAGEGIAVERESSHGMTYRMILESGTGASEFQLMCVTVAPDARRKSVSGSGMELIYMLAGTLDYRVGDDTIRLGPGDTLYFDGALPHVPVNRSGGDAVMLVLYLLSEEKVSQTRRK
ncbi:MAG: helix-turn-helix transcriptional regulator [Lentisphaeria bacterium]|nr:helix-turn-helix transcriptional regulator [Lentisphaeria bacterium]